MALPRRSTAPASAASGISCVYRGPAIARTAHGATSPTKAIGPHAAVAAAASNVIAAMPTTRVSATRLPSDRAMSSPSPSAVIPGPLSRARMPPAATSATSSGIVPVSRPASEPTCQKRMTSSDSLSSSTSAVVAALRIAPSADPVSASVTGVPFARPDHARVITSTVAPRAPARAAAMIARRLSTPNVNESSTTPKAAPALTPNRPGSASGLRVCPCMSAPAIPSASPTVRPSTVRGSRWVSSTVASGDRSPRKSAAKTCSGGIRLEPTSMLAAVVASTSRSATDSASRKRVRCERRARVGADTLSRLG